MLANVEEGHWSLGLFANANEIANASSSEPNPSDVVKTENIANEKESDSEFSEPGGISDSDSGEENLHIKVKEPKKQAPTKKNVRKVEAPKKEQPKADDNNTETKSEDILFSNNVLGEFMTTPEPQKKDVETDDLFGSSSDLLGLVTVKKPKEVLSHSQIYET